MAVQGGLLSCVRVSVCVQASVCVCVCRHGHTCIAQKGLHGHICVCKVFDVLEKSDEWEKVGVLSNLPQLEPLSSPTLV